MIRRLFAEWFPGAAGEPDDAAPAVETRALRKRYRAGSVIVEALRGIDLRIARGEFVAIVGPSGCGKTSLLNCLAGLETEYEGEVVLAGVPLRALADARRARLRARLTGFIFQSFNLLPTLSAVENVELPLLIAGLRGGAARAKAREILATVGLGDRFDHRPSQLSGGQQQRVAIARALISDPTLIVADEPTGDLDRTTAEEILGLLERLNRDLGKTIILVTHDPKAAEHARRLVHLEKGVLVF